MAAVRGEDIVGNSLFDVSEALKLMAGEYLDLLDWRPKEVARRLRGLLT